MSHTYRVAVIAGDGIGPEVVAEGLKVLDALAGRRDATFERTEYDLGAHRWHRTGETLPDTVLEEIRAHDVILLGAVGDPSVPSGILERGLLLRLRFELDHHVNLRPVKLYPGVATPLAGKTSADIDMVVVREGTEGPYAGFGWSPTTRYSARGRDRREPQHGVRRSSAWCATRSVERSADVSTFADVRAQEQRAHACR